MKVQQINAAIARAHKNALHAPTKAEQIKWEFHSQQLKKLLKNMGGATGRPKLSRR